MVVALIFHGRWMLGEVGREGSKSAANSFSSLLPVAFWSSQAIAVPLFQWSWVQKGIPQPQAPGLPSLGPTCLVQEGDPGRASRHVFIKCCVESCPKQDPCTSNPLVQETVWPAHSIQQSFSASLWRSTSWFIGPV
jgi:hypothetical protein